MFCKIKALEKAAVVAMLFSFFSGVLSAQEIQTEVVPKENEYVLFVESCDWGPAANKIVFNAGKVIIADVVNPEEFVVDILMKISEKGESSGFVKGKRSVLSAYVCDENGNKVSLKSKYVALELSVSPDDKSCSPFFSLPVISSFNQSYGLRITNDRLNISIVKRTGIESRLAGQFKEGKSILDGIEGKAGIVLPYVFWNPGDCSKKMPLIIFLHGITGGGTDPYVALFDAKTVSLITPEIQKYFPNGASVLVPQCPTGWLETTTTDAFGARVWAPVDIDGKINKITKPITNFFDKYIVPVDDSEKEEVEPYAAVSYYTVALKKLIDSYVAARPYIDKNRIYIGGCSAGGYMTVNMLIQYPDFFAAAFPTCEAYLNNKITDSQIQSLAKLPLWFTYAKNDENIKPESHCIPTIERLRAAGAENMHVSIFDDVHDTSGKYFMPTKKAEDEKVPYQYEGHLSWIYLFNNECEDNGLKLFDWLSNQKR